MFCPRPSPLSVLGRVRDPHGRRVGSNESGFGNGRRIHDFLSPEADVYIGIQAAREGSSIEPQPIMESRPPMCSWDWGWVEGALPPDRPLPPTHVRPGLWLFMHPGELFSGSAC